MNTKHYECKKCKTKWFSTTKGSETTLHGYCGCGDKLQRQMIVKSKDSDLDTADIADKMFEGVKKQTQKEEDPQ